MVNEVPIEGVGVVHVTTKPDDCPTDDYWECAVELALYIDGEFQERFCLTGAVAPADTAEELHTYFCDLETLVLCVRGDLRGLHPVWDLEYFDRKQLELFGRKS